MKSDIEHPYHALGAMKTLKTRFADMSPARIRALKTLVALTAADPTAAAKYTDLGDDGWLGFYPPRTQRTPDTDSAIQTFLELYGGKNDDAETALLERLIFNPTPDYATLLQQQEQAPGAPRDNQDTMIDAFLQQHATPATAAADATGTKAPGEATPGVAQGPSENSGQTQTQGRSKTQAGMPALPETPALPGADAAHGSLAESLAEVYVRQKRYRRAYDIISELNLNNPEKSVYFADQLRFLSKLIAIQQQRSAK